MRRRRNNSSRGYLRMLQYFKTSVSMDFTRAQIIGDLGRDANSSHIVRRHPEIPQSVTVNDLPLGPASVTAAKEAHVSLNHNPTIRKVIP